MEWRRIEWRGSLDDVLGGTEAEPGNDEGGQCGSALCGVGGRSGSDGNLNTEFTLTTCPQTATKLNRCHRRPELPSRSIWLVFSHSRH